MRQAEASIAGPLRFEHLSPHLPGGATLAGVPSPRLSWQIDASGDWRADAYELHSWGENRDDYAIVHADEQVLVPWPFAPLRSRERVVVRVRASSHGQWTPWSEPATVEAGLLEASDWKAEWITPVSSHPDAQGIAPVLSRTFDVDASTVVSARLYITARGIFRATLGGRRIGEEHFAPGWTPYDSMLRYRVYDVTAMLDRGPNRLSVVLGNGWFRGRIASQEIHRGRPYGDHLALLAQLELVHADGTRTTVHTDRSWTSGPSGILENDFYDGQTTDLRVTPSPIEPVALLPRDEVALELRAPEAPPVTTLREHADVTLSRARSGELLIDVGRVVVGWLRITLAGASGAEVVVRHAEVLEDGELCMRPLRSAAATDRYVLAEGEQVIEPEFTFHGFRYASVVGVSPEDIRRIAVVEIGTRNDVIGAFECSDGALTSLHDNIMASAEGNFLDIPTDCPQRDERLGWTGDIQIFAPTASALFDVAGFLRSWLGSLVIEQSPDGNVPLVVPNVLPLERPIAGWGDAAVVIPWVLHQRFGDEDVLREHLPSMTAWVDRLAALAGDDLLVPAEGQLGDWLDPLAPPEDPARSQADAGVVATAYLARSAQLVEDSARTLGDGETAAKYGRLARRVRDAFRAAFVAEDGRVLSDCQTVYALALAWDLLDGPQRLGAGRRLREIVRARGHTIATGFLGTPVILDALVKADAIEDAHAMLQNDRFPSWLHPLTLGASTMWERWDSLLPDGSVNPGEMTSFNHYAFGAVGDWMHRYIGGLVPMSPGYRTVLIHPRPPASVDSAAISHRTPYGWIRVSWKRRGDSITAEVEIPAGVRADVVLPGIRAHVSHGRHVFAPVEHSELVQ